MSEEGWLYDDTGEVLTDDDGAWLSTDSYTLPLADPVHPVGFQLDVCANFVRIGVCDVFTFAGVLRRNQVGEWEATIPEYGIEFDTGATITDVDSVILWQTGTPARIVYAGTMTPVMSSPAGLDTTIGPGGTRWTLTGVDLFGLLGTRIAYPDPTAPAPWADAYDERTGPASTVAADYIAANLGSAALPDRAVAGVTVTDPVVGATVTWTARLQPLSTLITQICDASGIVCRASMPTPGTIRYEFTTGADLTSQAIISDLDLSDTFKVSTRPARASVVIAGGSGDTTARLFATVDAGPTGIDRVESFYDVNNLTSSSAVTLAAQGSLLQQSAETSVDIPRMLPSRWAHLPAFSIGDTITVEAAGVRYPVLVDGVAFTVNPTESSIRPIIGRTTSNEAEQVLREVWGTTSRLDTTIR